MKTPFKLPILIIGGGPTGLGAAYMLHRSGCKDWLLCESEETTGGLSGSVRDGTGFTWDLGGHVVFSHYEFFSRLLACLLPPDEWIHHERESWIQIGTRWVPYPFQNNIRHLDPELCARCLDGLMAAALGGPSGPPANFRDFVAQTFGQGISELFMVPYNRKVWAYPPEELGVSWVGDRVAVPDVGRVARNVVLGLDDVGWGPNSKFDFPRRGGTGRIWTELTATLPKENILCRCEALEVDVNRRKIVFSDGVTRDYGTVISTVPMDTLARLSRRRDWCDLASGLMHSAVHVIGVGLKGQPTEDVRTKCWMYFPDPEIPFYRVTHFSRYSPENVDDITRHWSLMAEVSESPRKPVDASQVVQETVSALIRTGLVEDFNQVGHTWHTRLEHAYPTPTITRDQIVFRMLAEFEGRKVLSRGRFGTWLYEIGNMDHCFMQGMEAASRVVHGTPELTLWHPNAVNTPHPILGWNRLNWSIDP